MLLHNFSGDQSNGYQSSGYQSNPGTYPIYISDDLTKKNANLAFQARRLKTLKHISDTFVTNSRVFIKDNHGHIKQITSQMDIDRYA